MELECKSAKISKRYLSNKALQNELLGRILRRAQYPTASASTQQSSQAASEQQKTPFSFPEEKFYLNFSPKESIF